MTRTVAIMLACLSAAGWAVQSSGIIGGEYRADKAFPEYMSLWREGWGLKDARGETIQYAKEGMPLGGYIHVYFKNPMNQPLEIKDVLLDGVSLVEGIAVQGEHMQYHPASIRFSKLPKAQIKRLVSAGEPVWWRVNPEVVPPRGLAELVIRLRRDPKAATLSVRLPDASMEAWIEMGKTSPRIESISFPPGLDTVYLYFRHAKRGIAPSRVYLDGWDVTKNSETAADKASDMVPVVIRLSKPLETGSFHVFKLVCPDGSIALAGRRAWGSELVYGSFGSKSEGKTPAEMAKNYITDMLAHNINVHMGMYGGDSKPFMESKEGWDWLASVGMRQMATWHGNARNPLMYFLQDEPDAHDFGVDGLAPFARLGTLGMGLIEKSAELRGKDAVTPQLLNLDGTYKPDNWYTYAQLSDILCADPYYLAELDRVYSNEPAQFASYSKPTYVYAVGSICQSAGAPRPLHLILLSTKLDDANGRHSTPEEKRIEVYYALAAGAKGLSFWWYTPSGGCGADHPEARALWKEIGLLGAEVRTAGTVITRSCPITLPVTATPFLWVRTLVSGSDTMAVIVVNDDVACDRVGTVYKPVEKASVKVKLPSWLKPADAFEVTYSGTKDVTWTGQSEITLDLGTVQISRFVIVTSDPKLRSQLQAIYDDKFAANVAKLVKAQ